MYAPGDTVRFTFDASHDGERANADALPTATLIVNGVANAAAVTISNLATGAYEGTFTAPGALGDADHVLVSYVMFGKAQVVQRGFSGRLDNTVASRATQASLDGVETKVDAAKVVIDDTNSDLGELATDLNDGTLKVTPIDVDGITHASAMEMLMAALSNVARAHITQYITVSGASGGTYKLKYKDVIMASGLAHNASAAAVDTALEALSTIGSGNVTVSGSDGGPYTVTFGGTLDLDRLAILEVEDDSLTPSSAEVLIDTTVTFTKRDGSTGKLRLRFGSTDGTRRASTIL